MKILKIKSNNKGFSHIEIIGFLFVVSIIVLVGIKVIFNGHAQTISLTATNTYTYWHWPGKSYYNYDVYVTPQNDPSPEGIFWANYFTFIKGNGGYVGIQTEGDNPTGKIAVFSIWDALSSSGPDYAGTFGGEGVGYTARISYNWKPRDTYRLRVWAIGKVANGYSWGAWIKDMTTNSADSSIGQITVPASWSFLSSQNNSSWTELYSPLTSCSAIIPAIATFTNARANDDTVSPTGYQNILQTHRTCTNSTIVDLNFKELQKIEPSNLIY